MKKIIEFCAWGTLMLSLCLAGVAYATEPPDECNDDGPNERYYDLGIVKGVSLVNQAWAGLGPDPCDDDNLLEFGDIVATAFEAGAPDPDSPQTVLCHYVGSYVGAIGRVSELHYDCSHCCLEGHMIGEMAAIFYCQLSIALGGLGLDEWLVEGDLTLCGEFFVECCQDRFVALSVSYPSEEDPQCLAYTPYYHLPDYEEVWYQTRHNQCVYDIEEQ